MTVSREPSAAAAVATDPKPTEPTGSARSVTTPARLWRQVRFPAVVAAGVVLVVVLMAALLGPIRGGELGLDSPEPAGARALAELLRRRGVEVARTSAYTGGSDRTVFVPLPERLGTASLDELRRQTGPLDVVLVGADRDELAALGLVGVRFRLLVRPETAVPECALPEAAAAGVALTGGATYDVEGDVTACYPHQGHPSVVVVRRGQVRFVLVGTPQPFTNANLDEDGNAALALGLLSRHRYVEWLRPGLSEVGSRDEQQPLLSLLPRGVRSGFVQLVVAALLAAVWRARRLGPVVTEPLPVVVRAAEAVEGRARLYQAARARERAAAALRAAVRTRLARALGLPHDADRTTVVPVVAARSRLDSTTVDQLLYGPPPPDDAELVRLAGRLDSLDSEVRHT